MGMAISYHCAACDLAIVGSQVATFRFEIPSLLRLPLWEGKSKHSCLSSPPCHPLYENFPGSTCRPSEDAGVAREVRVPSPWNTGGGDGGDCLTLSGMDVFFLNLIHQLASPLPSLQACLDVPQSLKKFKSNTMCLQRSFKLQLHKAVHLFSCICEPE